MTKPSTKADKSETEAMNAVLDSMMALNPMRETVMKAWFDMGTEALRFASSRMQQDVETQTAMLACKNLEDIQKVQADFYNRALDEYRAGTSRMMEIMMSAATGGLGVDLPDTRRKYNDVPL